MQVRINYFLTIMCLSCKRNILYTVHPGKELLSEHKYIIHTAHLGDERMSSLFCLSSLYAKKSQDAFSQPNHLLLWRKSKLPLFSKTGWKKEGKAENVDRGGNVYYKEEENASRN